MTSRAVLSCRATGAVTLLALLAAGCGSGSEEPAAPSTPTASSTSTAPVPTPATPTVEPADGKLIKVPGATMRALPTYERVVDYGIVQGYNDDRSALSLSPNLTRARSLDAYAREYARKNGGPRVMRRQDDVVVGGQYSAWHLVDRSDPTEVAHSYGVMFLDGAWLINIDIYQGRSSSLTEEEGQQVIDSLLATFEVQTA